MSDREMTKPARCARMMLGWLGCAVIAAAGCGHYGPPPARAGEHRGEARVPDDEVPDVAAAALPYHVLDARTGREVASSDFAAALAGAQAICVGEDHPNPHHHWAQLQVLELIAPTGDAPAGDAPASAPTLGVGFEMFQRPFQGVLDDFAAGRIDEAALLSRTAWADRWGFDWALYQPLVGLAVARGAALLALNTPRELTKRVSRKGLESFTATELAALPALVLDDAEHEAWFEALMSSMGGDGHGHGHGAGKAGDDETGAVAIEQTPAQQAEAERERVAHARRIYTAQVLWDETMADSAARWLGGGPGRRIVIFAGNGHCHDSAIVRRLQRRGIAGVVSVRPIIDDGENVAAELVKPMTDYLFAMSMPAAD